eukprot:scaffold123253_cov41-Prasinocladus_malaysianus.AAC.2
MSELQAPTNGVDWQARQSLADIKLSNSFCDASGAYESHAQVQYGYHTGSQLMQNPQAESGTNVTGVSKPVGIPVTQEELRAYGQRVMRPGQVQDFGAVLLVGTYVLVSTLPVLPAVRIPVSFTVPAASPGRPKPEAFSRTPFPKP